MAKTIIIHGRRLDGYDPGFVRELAAFRLAEKHGHPARAPEEFGEALPDDHS